LHPVLIIALLPVAQYFFGIWGLILATPVAVYVIHVLILRRGLPGTHDVEEKKDAVMVAADNTAASTVASQAEGEAGREMAIPPAR
jgi:hypothetical protein